MLEKQVPEKIINKYGIELLLVFGSYADGTYTQKSDLDLGFLSRELLTNEQELDLLADLIRFYQKGAIDLVDLKKASPVLKLEAANRGKLIYGTEETLLKFQLYAAARFADTKFLREERQKYLQERMRRL